jgi:hypothetical protein
MTVDIENICTAFHTCMTASVRRWHLKAKFDPNAPPAAATVLPRQHYGIDFYENYNGEIMVIVDLFTRETILTHLNKRTQDNDVAQALLKHIIFQRGFPRTLRTG